MFSQGKRQLWKRTLSLARVKLLYTRITLTRFTTLYFFFALASCAILSALQAVTFVDNSNAVAALKTKLEGVAIEGLAIVDNDELLVCTSIPNQAGTNCTLLLTFGEDLDKRDGLLADDLEDILGTLNSAGLMGNPVINTVPDNISLSFEDTCIPSLQWLDDVIHDAQREDVVTFLFQIWLFILALVTIVNESIPHLMAAVAGHLLGAGWSAYRVDSTRRLMNLYRTKIVPEACGGEDLLQNWWEIRIQHAIPILAVNCLTLLAFGYLSFQLFKVYATQSFSRVGASPKIHRMYKFVLLFSVCLQLSGFFSLTSTAMWIDKVCHGMIMALAKHAKLYLAAFSVILVLQLPWFIFGWVCVRKECKIRFAIFCGIAVLLLTLQTMMFFSPLYRYIFLTWPFFATITVTAYLLIIATTAMGILCRLNFDKGLAHYLQVTEALDGVDFTPVYFPKGREVDPEKATALETKLSEKSDDAHLTTVIALPLAAQQSPTERKQRGESIYSEQDGTPIFLSSSPPLVSDLAPAPSLRSSRSLRSTRSRLSKPPPQRSTSLRSVRIEEKKQGKSDSGVPVVPPSVRPAPRVLTAPGRRYRDSKSPIRLSPASPSPRVPLPPAPSPPPGYDETSPQKTRSTSPTKQGLPTNPRPGKF
ncbi:hypothetical protein NLJ89_g2146 [Agrocybe chaxingu]|uniref:Uncharacterized protein n=1 Tax=Agrocybe chaxingu TaxID=84603 RepID=A0A9W8K4Y0_9AGAR|nr:hypothetical protein NLJ89_g2146 [Agrocybe chaxingu]